MRLLGIGRAAPVPGAKTIWTFREERRRAGAVKALFGRFADPRRRDQREVGGEAGCLEPEHAAPQLDPYQFVS